MTAAPTRPCPKRCGPPPNMPGASVLSHPVNRGKGQALFTGARAAKGDLIVFLDADLDLPPEQLPALLDGIGRCRCPGRCQARLHGRRPLSRSSEGC